LSSGLWRMLFLGGNSKMNCSRCSAETVEIVSSNSKRYFYCGNCGKLTIGEQKEGILVAVTVYAIRIECPGEAHKNPYIDHCSVCMPDWGEFFLCPKCGSRLIPGNLDYKRWCKTCRKSFLL